MPRTSTDTCHNHLMHLLALSCTGLCKIVNIGCRPLHGRSRKMRCVIHRHVHSCKSRRRALSERSHKANAGAGDLAHVALNPAVLLCAKIYEYRLAFAVPQKRCFSLPQHSSSPHPSRADCLPKRPSSPAPRQHCTTSFIVAVVLPHLDLMSSIHPCPTPSNRLSLINRLSFSLSAPHFRLLTLLTPHCQPFPPLPPPARHSPGKASSSSPSPPYQKRTTLARHRLTPHTPMSSAASSSTKRSPPRFCEPAPSPPFLSLPTSPRRPHRHPHGGQPIAIACKCQNSHVGRWPQAWMLVAEILHGIRSNAHRHTQLQAYTSGSHMAVAML